MIDHRLIKNFDLRLFLVLVALCLMGLLTLYSATYGLEEGGDPLHFVKRQTLWLGVGFAGMFLICLIDYVNFFSWARYIYLGGLFLLGLVLFAGKSAGGAMRWISLGAFDLQPSEVAKICLIIFLARLLADKKEGLYYFSGLLPALAATGLPMLLVFLQPDLGTSLVFIALLLVMLLVAGARSRYLWGLLATGAALTPVLWHYLENYQKMRLMVFIDPGMDPTGYGWQLMQSMIAIGSGGLLGKGFMGSTQVRLQFLPVHYSDFIFSVLGEEAGFIGAFGLLILYFLLIYRILWIGIHSKDHFGALICCGVASMFAFQVMVNAGMTISIMPVTGIPLPFMSYGNNALLVNLAAMGLVFNVGMRRHKIQF